MCMIHTHVNERRSIVLLVLSSLPLHRTAATTDPNHHHHHQHRRGKNITRKKTRNTKPTKQPAGVSGPTPGTRKQHVPTHTPRLGNTVARTTHTITQYVSVKSTIPWITHRVPVHPGRLKPHSGLVGGYIHTSLPTVEAAHHTPRAPCYIRQQRTDGRLVRASCRNNSSGILQSCCLSDCLPYTRFSLWLRLEDSIFSSCQQQKNKKKKRRITCANKRANTHRHTHTKKSPWMAYFG